MKSLEEGGGQQKGKEREGGSDRITVKYDMAEAKGEGRERNLRE